MNLFEELFQPIGINNFEDNFLYQKPCAVPRAGIRFYKLIGWDLLIDIFSSGYENCWLAKKGRLYKDTSKNQPASLSTQSNTGRLDLETAQAGFEEGYTIVVRHSELAHPKLKAIADEFTAHYNLPVDIQLYCTPAGEQGFDWHYDIEEVFVIQSAGQKEFRLVKNKNSNPIPFGHFPKTAILKDHMEGPEIRCLLSAGDVLYIPSGYWHCANAITPSFHLSVGVLKRSADP